MITKEQVYQTLKKLKNNAQIKARQIKKEHLLEVCDEYGVITKDWSGE